MFPTRRLTDSLRYILLGLALLVAQQAAQLHGLSHLRHELAVAKSGEKKAPPLGHPAEQCVAHHAVGSALPNVQLAFEPPRLASPAVAAFQVLLISSPRLAFDSRAPPALS